MKPVLVKLVLVLVALVGWMVYDNWHVVEQMSVAKFVDATTKKLPKRLIPKTSNNVTEVYQWKDTSGKTHFSNTRPEGIDVVTIKKISSDQNVLQSNDGSANVPKLADAADDPAAADNSFPLSPTRFKEAIDKAKEVRQGAEQRNKTLDEIAK